MRARDGLHQPHAERVVGAYAGHFFEIRDGCVHDSRETAERLERRAGCFFAVSPWRGESQQQLDYLVIGELVQPELEKLLPKPLPVSFRFVVHVPCVSDENVGDSEGHQPHAYHAVYVEERDVDFGQVVGAHQPMLVQKKPRR